MKFGVVNKSTILNRFVLHTLQRNITHLAVITRKTNLKLGILRGGNWKRAEKTFIFYFHVQCPTQLEIFPTEHNKKNAQQKEHNKKIF